MIKRFVYIAGFLLITIVSPSFATVDLMLDQTFTVPIFGAIDFNDIDGAVEVLIVSNDDIVIYSPLLDQVLFTTTIDSTDKYYVDRVLFEDVNHDHISDIIFLLRWLTFNPVNFKITMYDGASDFQNVVSVMHTAPLSFGTVFQQFRSLDVIDWNNDGYNNLVISLDSISEISGTDSMKISGCTYTYYSFPDSIIATEYDTMSLSNIIEIPSTYDLGAFTATRHIDHWSGIPGEMPVYNSKGVVISNSITGHTMEMIKPNQCSGEMDSLPTNNLSPQCLFDLNPSDDYLQIVSLFDWSQTCLSGFPGGYSGSEISLHYLLDSDISGLQWSIPNDGYYEFMRHLNYPGYFFAISSIENSVVMFNGLNGEIIDQSIDLGEGNKYWDEIVDGEIPNLIIIDSNNVKIYKLGSYLDISDQTEYAILPTSFTLSQPYPNPFNASLSIPLELKNKAFTTIEAFNLLGRKVDVIYNDNLQQGEHKLTWVANNFSSGIYLIKVRVDHQTQTVKAILLK